MKHLLKLITGTATALMLSTQMATADMKIGLAAEPYPPFSEKGADGKWVGWEIELMDAVCAAMEEECEVVEVAWDGIIPALLAKKFDVIMSSMSITEERMKTIAFTNKYYNTPAVIVAAKGSSITSDPASVVGQNVGVQVSTIHANYVEKYFTDAKAKTYQTFDEHNQDLVAGRVDAVVGDSLAMSPFLASDAGKAFEIKGILKDEKIFGVGAGGGMRKEDTALRNKFNAALDKIRADGTYDKIGKKYFDFDIYGG